MTVSLKDGRLVLFQRIKTLHAVYADKCDLMCQRIMNANAALDAAISRNKQVTPELQQALTEVARFQPLSSWSRTRIKRWNIFGTNTGAIPKAGNDLRPSLPRQKVLAGHRRQHYRYDR